VTKEQLILIYKLNQSGNCIVLRQKQKIHLDYSLRFTQQSLKKISFEKLINLFLLKTAIKDKSKYT